MFFVSLLNDVPILVELHTSMNSSYTKILKCIHGVEGNSERKELEATISLL